MIRLASLTVLGGLLIATLASAQAPTVIPFQARLTDNTGAVIAPNSTVAFEIFDALTAGTRVYGPEAHVVTPQNGVVNVMIGGGSPAIPLSPAVFSAANRFLQVTVNGQVLAPRIQLGTSPYAFRAETVPNLSITATQLADNAVTRAKIADEPGIASVSTTTDNTLTTTAENLVSRSLNYPASGYVVAISSVNMTLNHVTGTPSEVYTSISTTSATHSSANLKVTRLSNLLPTSTNRFSVSNQEFYSVAGAGTLTVYAVASGASGTGHSAIESSLILMYFPTAYGSVTAPNSIEEAAAPPAAGSDR